MKVTVVVVAEASVAAEAGPTASAGAESLLLLLLSLADASWGAADDRWLSAAANGRRWSSSSAT